MAKAIVKLENGLSIRYIKKDKAYFITYGVMHIEVNGEYSRGYATQEQAEYIASVLQPTHFSNKWTLLSTNQAIKKD